jgi:hypothetical protein
MRFSPRTLFAHSHIVRLNRFTVLWDREVRTYTQHTIYRNKSAPWRKLQCQIGHNRRSAQSVKHAVDVLLIRDCNMCVRRVRAAM